MWNAYFTVDRTRWAPLGEDDCPFRACCLALIVAGSLAGCAQPQVVQATDCRGATQPCGVVVVDRTHAMSSLPVTVPVSAVPSLL